MSYLQRPCLRGRPTSCSEDQSPSPRAASWQALLILDGGLEGITVSHREFASLNQLRQEMQQTLPAWTIRAYARCFCNDPIESLYAPHRILWRLAGETAVRTMSNA